MRRLLASLLPCLLRFLFSFLPLAPLASHGLWRRKAASLVRSARKPAWVAGWIIRLKALMRDAGCRRIADSFNRCHAARTGVRVGKSFVADTLRAQHYAILRERRHLRRRRTGSGPRNIVWGLDLTGKQDSTHRSWDILGVIDHGTRRLLELTALAAPSSWTVLGHLCLLIGRFGKPRAVRTDNGAIFTARCFGAGLALMVIRHQRSAVGCPWQNGRIERLFGTLKSKLDHWSVANRQELSRALDLFLIWYNAVRPHKALDGRTPLETWHGIDPFARPPRGVTGFSAWDGMLTGVLIRR